MERYFWEPTDELCKVCGGRIETNDERAEVVLNDDWDNPLVASMLVHEPCYNRETMGLA